MKLNERIMFFFLHCLSRLAGKINPCRRVVWAQKIGGFVYRYIPTRKYLALSNEYGTEGVCTASRLFQKKNISTQERFHQDGIMFDLNSPEAFDEVFFSSFDTSEIKDEFLNYILNKIVSSAYNGMDKDLVDDKNAEARLIDLIKKNPDSKEYYVALYSHYVAIGNVSKAGDIQVKILNRFY